MVNQSDKHQCSGDTTTGNVLSALVQVDSLADRRGRRAREGTRRLAMMLMNKTGQNKARSLTIVFVLLQQAEFSSRRRLSPLLVLHPLHGIAKRRHGTYRWCALTQSRLRVQAVRVCVCGRRWAFIGNPAAGVVVRKNCASRFPASYQLRLAGAIPHWRAARESARAKLASVAHCSNIIGSCYAHEAHRESTRERYTPLHRNTPSGRHMEARPETRCRRRSQHPHRHRQRRQPHTLWHGMTVTRLAVSLTALVLLLVGPAVGKVREQRFRSRRNRRRLFAPPTHVWCAQTMADMARQGISDMACADMENLLDAAGRIRSSRLSGMMLYWCIPHAFTS